MRQPHGRFLKRFDVLVIVGALALYLVVRLAG